MNSERQASVELIGCRCCGGFGFIAPGAASQGELASYAFGGENDPIKTHKVMCQQMIIRRLQIITRKRSFEGDHDGK